MRCLSLGLTVVLTVVAATPAPRGRRGSGVFVPVPWHGPLPATRERWTPALGLRPSGRRRPRRAAARRGRLGRPPSRDPISARSAPVGWRPGPGGGRDLRVDLSAAHSLTRLFAMDSPYATADAALAAALSADGSLTSGGLGAALAVFAEALPDVCVAPAGAQDEMPKAEVAMIEHVAVIRPGTGEVRLPPEARLAVVDSAACRRRGERPSAWPRPSRRPCGPFHSAAAAFPSRAQRPQG